MPLHGVPKRGLSFILEYSNTFLEMIADNTHFPDMALRNILTGYITLDMRMRGQVFGLLMRKTKIYVYQFVSLGPYGLKLAAFEVQPI